MILVLFGLVSVVVQFTGAYFLVNTYRSLESTIEERQTVLNVLRIGLGLQLVILGVFVVVSSRFVCISYLGNYQPLSHTSRSGAYWNRLNWAVYAAIMAIAVS
jgi:hypothetical protein